MTVHGTTYKKAITKDPFVMEFQYGAAKEGYWSYEHLVCQLEDCMDVMQTLFPDFDVKFNVDHSCGHDRQRPDALNVNNMNQGYGGKQTCMHDSIMTDRTLGRHNSVLKVGDIQSFVWKEGDTGPMDMSPAEREYLRNGDSSTFKFVNKSKARLKKALLDSKINLKWKEQNVMLLGGKLKTENGRERLINEMRSLCRKHCIEWKSKKAITVKVVEEDATMDELVDALKIKNIAIPKHYVKKVLVDLAKDRNIPTKVTRTKGIVDSWIGKPKGMLQIAYERGLLDLDNFCVEDFKETGKLEVTKTVIKRHHCMISY